MSASSSNQADNPLINPPQGIPNNAPPLDQIREEHFEPAIDWALDQARARIQAIRDNPDDPTFENTIEALEFASEELGNIMSVFGMMKNANNTQGMQAIEQNVNPKLSEFGSDVGLDEVLAARVEAVYQQRDRLNLDKEQRALLEDNYKTYQRSGVNLQDPAAKQRIRDIDARLKELTSEFMNNLLAAHGNYKRWVSDETELAGVPERIKTKLRENAAEEGYPDHWLIRMNPFQVMEMTSYAENRELRHELAKALGDRAYGDENDTTAEIMEIVSLRDEKAKLLGYSTYAEMILEDRMAGSTQTVENFLETNRQVYKPEAEAHLQRVRDYAWQKDGLSDFQSWDYAYYNRCLKEETFDFDEEELREYFELDTVLSGMFDHARKLFGIDFVEASESYPVNHEDVRVYEVTDQNSGETIGVLYTDYYAREGTKKDGAWMQPLRSRGLSGGENRVPLTVNCCNFAKPAEGEPTLLSMDDVETAFHEFGHALHELLAEGNYPSLTGASVKWDFVELPSQLMENWARSPEVLQEFARHHKTGDPVPAELIEKKNKAGNFDVAVTYLRQTFIGMLDMAWHNQDADHISSVEALEDSVGAYASLFERPGGPLSTSVHHFFADPQSPYAAGYYSYKWAEVLEADIFEQFQQRGNLYDADLARRLRHLYASGDTVDPNDLFSHVVGRAPDPAAAFRREGLEPPQTKSGKGPKQDRGPKPDQ